MVQLQIQLLGGLSISLNEIDVLPGRRNTRTALLLAYLLLKPGKRISRQYLAYTFWPDSGDVQARTNLRGLLASLRKQAPELFAYIRDDDPYLSWRLDGSQTIDVVEFEAALHRADSLAQTDREKAIGALKEAVSLYRGELLPGHYEEWVLAERQRLQTALLDALAWLIELLEESRQGREAVYYAEMLLQIDRLRETSYLLLMRQHAATGNRARALAVYSDCRRLLINELGIEPGPAIEELHRQLLQDEPPSIVDSLPDHRSLDLPSLSTRVGRAHEWSKLLESWRSVEDGYSHVVVIVGEPGSGKSRLVQDLIAWCEARNVVTVTTQCPQAKEPIGYVAVASCLMSPKIAHRLVGLTQDQQASLVTLAPGLRRHFSNWQPMQVQAPHWQRLHLYQAAASLFVGSDEPTLLFLDDAQWCDEQSLEWLQYMLAVYPQARLLVVMAVRADAMEEQPFARAKSDLLARGRLKQIALTPLSLEETRELAEQIMNRPLTDEAMELLHATAAGNPFYIVEIARTFAFPSPGAPVLDKDALFRILPDTVAALILQRLAFLSQPARHLLDVAAVIGASFTVSSLSKVSQLPEDACVDALDELWRRRLIVNSSDDRYDFSHEIVRDVIYQRLSDVRRRHLHRRVAETLAERA